MDKHFCVCEMHYQPDNICILSVTRVHHLVSYKMHATLTKRTHHDEY